MWTRVIGLAAVLLFGLTAGVRGQVLADRVPADAIVYVGWAGADVVGPACKGTHLQGVLDHSDIPAFATEFLPQLLDKLGTDAPPAAIATQFLENVVPPMWRHPTALYFAGLDDHHVPRIAVLCQAGADANQLEQTINAAIDRAPMPVKPQVEIVGDVLVLCTGFDKPADALAEQEKALDTDAQFKKAFTRADASAPVVAYANLSRAISMLEKLPGQAANGGPSPAVVMDALGLSDLQSAAFSAQFSGKEWMAKWFVAAPAPRTGILALNDKPMDPSILQLAPASSTRVAAGELDLSALLQTIRTVAGKVNPDAAQGIDGAIDQADQMIGIHLQDDLLGGFGPDWVVYTDPDTAGQGMMGFVLANRPRHADTLESSLDKLEQFANPMIKQALHNPKLTLAFRKATIGGITVHYLGTPLVTPAWAIHDGVWYFSLFPSVTASAATGNAGGKSFLDNHPELTEMIKHTAGNFTGVRYVDLPALLPQTYQGWLAVSRLAGGGDLIGVPAPTMLLPEYHDLLAELSPILVTTWTDADGLFVRATEPFPGSALLASDPLSVTSLQSQPLALSILLPALSRAREQANRAKSASNLRQIGLGAIMYSNGQKDGSFPDSLSQLMDTQQLPAVLFVNPRSNTSVPRNLTKDQLDAWVDNDSDYVWVGKGKKSTAGADEVLAYEKPRGMKQGINILFADGHVEFDIMPVAAQKIPGLDTGADRPKPQPSDGGL